MKLDKVWMFNIIILISLSGILNLSYANMDTNNTNLSGGFSCSTSMIKTDSNSNLSTFNSNDYNFKLQFPSKWNGEINSCIPNIEDMSFIPMTVVVNLTSTKNSLEERGFVWITITLDNKGTLEQQMEYKKSFGNILNMTSQNSTQFKGLPAFKEIYDYGYGKLETINFIYDENFFTIEYPLLANNSSKTIENILNSFEFLDSNLNKSIDPSVELG